MSATPNINPLKIIGNVLNKFDGTQEPTSSNDSTQGYAVGSVWVDVTNNKAYTCVDSTATSAVWNEAGGGGDSIYTANGTLNSDRTVDINGKDFEIIDTSVTNTASISIGSGQGFVFNRNSALSAVVYSSNSVNHSEFGKGLTYLSADTINLGSTGGANGLKIEIDRVRYYSNSAILHDIHAQRFALFGQGFSTPANSYFSIGSFTQFGTEKISLQGHTAIKGAGTTTGTTLALYDNDSTPSKTWEWLDNGTMKGYNTAKIQDALILPSVQELANSATFTINADQQSDGVLTAMSASTTIAAPTGTPVQSQDLVFRFKDNGTAQALAWNGVFRAIGVTLPTTTVSGKLTYVGCKYNSTDSKWDVVAVQQEA
tara:strand:+ start:2281 stop:3393 length:1113 start_codon:yes stop_codon:yes gene_type:complete